MRNQSSVLAAIALAALATACASSRDVDAVGGSSCTGCHGGKNDTSGAPPFDVQGATSSVAVGAHARHLAVGVTCETCHRVPASVGAPGHADGTVDVVFGPAAQDPFSASTAAYVSATHTCSSVYCHAPTWAPGGTTPPPWDGAITGCGDCHAAVPASHGAIGSFACSTCHQTTVADPGVLPTIIPGGAHANGAKDASAHDPGFTQSNANGVTPHGLAALYRNLGAFPNGLADCRACHGATLDAGIISGIPSCDNCHQDFSQPGTAGTDWRTDCTFCHGDLNRTDASYQLTDAAPPRDAAGSQTSARVGVHQSHLFGGATPISAGVACDKCHAVQTDLGHVDGTAAVALKDPAGSASGAFTPGAGGAAGTCATTYCHGSFTGGAAANTPSWTGAGTQTCSTCHGAPPNTGRHPGADNAPGGHGSLNCQHCHFDVATTGAIKPGGRALHVNGAKDVKLSTNGTIASGNGAWNGTSCTGSCHGSGTPTWNP